MDPHDLAMAERRAKTINAAVRIFWLPTQFKDYEINIGIQITNNDDIAQLDSLDVSKMIDTIDQSNVQSNILELMMVSDVIYNYVANYYVKHDIQVNIMNFGQPVLSINYPFNNSPF